MKTVIKTGKSIEEAIEFALLELGVKQDQVEVEVLEEPGKRSIFGLFAGKPAKVSVKYQDDPTEMASTFLEKVCGAMGVVAKFEKSQTPSGFMINITGPDLGILIGRRGDTLDALQYLINLAVQRHFSERTRIIIDVEGYRLRREETLVRLAKRLSDRVIKTGYKVVLEPMNPQERRIIHTALQDDSRVSTFSEGEEPFRKVVISLKGKL
ncbi:MAG: protein jag [Peptococcaceae bacterium]|nr:protein jag [Peptococcaceae bacterium]